MLIILRRRSHRSQGVRFHSCQSHLPGTCGEINKSDLNGTTTRDLVSEGRKEMRPAKWHRTRGNDDEWNLTERSRKVVLLLLRYLDTRRAAVSLGLLLSLLRKLCAQFADGSTPLLRLKAAHIPD